MTVAEFIVETQWTLLILLVLLSFALAMVCSGNFRAAVLRRSWTVGPEGITSELPAVPDEALTAAAKSDQQVAEELASADKPVNQETVTAHRLEAIETLLRDAVMRGWASGQAGSPSPPAPRISHGAGEAPRMGYVQETHNRAEHRTSSSSRDTTVNIWGGEVVIRGLGDAPGSNAPGSGDDAPRDE